MAHLSVMASRRTIPPPPPSGFSLLALYCYTPLPGWPPTPHCLLTPHCSWCSVGIPSARWLRSPTFLSPFRDLLYRRKPRLGYDASLYCTTSGAHSKCGRVTTFRSLSTAQPPSQPEIHSTGSLIRQIGNSGCISYHP